MVRSLIKNISPVSWFLWFTGTSYCLGLEQCSEMNIVCQDIAQNRKDPVGQQINLQHVVSVRRCNFLDCTTTLSQSVACPTEKLCFSRWFEAAGVWYQPSPGMEQKLLCSPRSNAGLPIWHCLEGCTCSGYNSIPAYNHTDAEFPGHPPAPHQPWCELLCLDLLYPVCINH